MELIEIIKSSLSIFSTTAFVFITVSYAIYKIKDRSRTKPYLRVNVQTPLNGIIIDKKDVKTNANMEEKPAEEKQFNRIVLVKLPIQNRFKIINGDKPIEKLNRPEYKKENPMHLLKPDKDKKNIYDFYARTDERMHQLKIAIR